MVAIRVTERIALLPTCLFDIAALGLWYIPVRRYCCSLLLLLAQLPRVMAHCSSLYKAGRVMGVEDIDEALVAVELERAFGEEPAVSLAGGGVPSEGAVTHTHYFGASTITVGKIKEMEERGYFTKDEAHASRAKTVPEPRDDEVVVFEYFFVAGLCMPLHPAMADILLCFRA
jgi:hypothetical protein